MICLFCKSTSKDKKGKKFCSDKCRVLIIVKDCLKNEDIIYGQEIILKKGQ
jgi:hypothetical protein